MNEIIETLKVVGVNAATFGVVTLSDLELILKCILLLITITYTFFKATAAWRAINDKEK